MHFTEYDTRLAAYARLVDPQDYVGPTPSTLHAPPWVSRYAASVEPPPEQPEVRDRRPGTINAPHSCESVQARTSILRPEGVGKLIRHTCRYLPPTSGHLIAPHAHSVDASARSKDGSTHVTNERFNTISHLFAACFALLGAGLLITEAASQGDPWKIVGVSVYGLSLVMLFTTSTLHHGIDGSPSLNEALRTLDYDSVFFLIAGTVTPLVLVLVRNTYGWTVFGAVWAIAVAGIVLRSVWRRVPKYITNTLYISLGWLTVALIGGDISLPIPALALLAAGGLIYSIGFVIFVIERPNLWPGIFGFHELWHLLVVIASLLHYLLIYLYVLP